MDTFVFNDEPNGENIKTILGKSFGLFEFIISDLTGYSSEWKNYGKKYGWIFKVFDKKKVLYWISPKQGWFNLSMAVRENERGLLLEYYRGNDEIIFKKIESAEKFPEGYSLLFRIEKIEELDKIKKIINEIIDIRKTKK